MSYKACSVDIAESIQMDCEKPLVGGYSGRAVGFVLSPRPTITYDATNKLKVKNITTESNKGMFAIVNFGEQPFSGSTSASSADSGIMRHLKNFQFNVLKRGADASKNIIDPITRLPLGFLVIAERMDGTYEVLGVENGLKVNADGVTSDPYANDGATQIIASCRQYNYEYEYVGTEDGAENVQKEFEAMLALCI